MGAACSAARPGKLALALERIGALSSLYISADGDFVSEKPLFAPGVLDYTIDVENKIQYVLLTPIAMNELDTMRVSLKKKSKKIHVKKSHDPLVESMLASSAAAAAAAASGGAGTGAASTTEKRESDEDDDDDDENDQETDDEEDGAKGGKSGSVTSYLVGPLPEGRLEVVIELRGRLPAAEGQLHGEVRSKTYMVSVEREAWDVDGWKPGTERDKYKHYLRGAEDGNAHAQYLLAMLHSGEEGTVMLPRDGDEGDLVPESREEAMLNYFRWLCKAAEQDHADAQYRLGLIYYNRSVPDQAWQELQARMPSTDNLGDGDEKSAQESFFRSQATRWLSASANSGNKEATHQLGVLYAEGSGDVVDYRKAIEWLRKAGESKATAREIVAAKLKDAADAGNEDACRQLSELYVKGIGVDKSFEAAIIYLTRSGTSRLKAAESVAADFSADAKLHEDSAEQLAEMYMLGVGLSMSYKRAIHWFMKAGKSKEASVEIVSKRLVALAADGDVNACHQCALLYVDGSGVKMDYSIALDYLDKTDMAPSDAKVFVYERFLEAAKKGDRESAYQLGLMHVYGKGCDMDYTKALEWLTTAGVSRDESHRLVADLFLRSADDGDASAAYQMALLYVDEIGVAASYESALAYMQKAGKPGYVASEEIFNRFGGYASQGNVRSAYQMALMCVDGAGTDMSYERALEFMKQAGVSDDEARSTVFDRLRKAALEGNTDSCKQVALMYVDGIGTEMSYKLALEWLDKGRVSPVDAPPLVANRLRAAGKKGNKSSAYQLALMHLDGVGVDKDYRKALYWMEKAGRKPNDAVSATVSAYQSAADRKSPRGCRQLALMHVDGIGVDMSYKAALKWLRESGEDSKAAEKLVVDRLRAAADKSPNSAYQLALMFVDGVGVDMDYKEALKWMDKAGQPSQFAHKHAAERFREAAEQGNAHSAFQLALMHCDGVGVEMDYKKALYWLERGEQAELFAQKLVFQRLQEAAENSNPRSAHQLADMFMDYEKSLLWLADDHGEYWFHQHAAFWYKQAAEQGDPKAALTIARMFVDGVGVPNNFKEAMHWYVQAGKEKSYARNIIQKKLHELKPMYEALYQAYAERSKDGVIDEVNFQGFYRDCLLAKGFTKKKANAETVSMYQGNKKYQVLFHSYDRNDDHSIDFDEIWAHPHTHTSLFPKTGAHYMGAMAFFAKWQKNSLMSQKSVRDLDALVESKSPSYVRTPRSLPRSLSTQSNTLVSPPRSRRGSMEEVDTDEESTPMAAFHVEL